MKDILSRDRDPKIHKFGKMEQFFFTNKTPGIQIVTTGNFYIQRKSTKSQASL